MLFNPCGIYGSVSGDESGIGSIAGYTSGHVTSCYAVLPDGITSIKLVGKSKSYDPDHCVEAGGNNYETLINSVNDLKAADGSTWKAENIWKLTAGTTPAIESDYIGESAN